MNLIFITLAMQVCKNRRKGHHLLTTPLEAHQMNNMRIERANNSISSI